MVTWSHHYREQNKIADCAANHAMNHKRLKQYLLGERPEAEAIRALMKSELGTGCSTTTKGTAGRRKWSFLQPDFGKPQQQNQVLRSMGTVCFR